VNNWKDLLGGNYFRSALNSAVCILSCHDFNAILPDVDLAATSEKILYTLKFSEIIFARILVFALPGQPEILTLV